MTSAITGISVTSTPPLANAAAPAIAARGMQEFSEPKVAMSPAAQASIPDPPGNGTQRAAQIGIQVSNALLGLSVAGTANAASAPQAPPPVAASPTASTAPAADPAPAGQTTDNESTGANSADSTGSGASAPAFSQNEPDNTAAQNTAGSNKKPVYAQSHLAFSPLPVIPRWHIRPAARNI